MIAKRSVADYLRQRTPLLFGTSGVALACAGMVGYVGGRMTADYRFVGLVFFSTYVVLAGIVLFDVMVFIILPRMRKPVVLLTFGALAILFGILLVAFPYERAAAFPMGAVAASLVLLLVMGWRDFSNPELWKSKSSS